MATDVRPPGPRLSPLAALRAFRREPLALLERLATYGDVVRIRVPRADAYLLNHPDVVQGALVTDHRASTRARRSRPPRCCSAPRS